VHFIPYINNIELLKKSYDSARLLPEVLIIDSRGLFSFEEDPSEAITLEDNHGILKLPIALTTAQMMMLMLSMTIEAEDPYFTWQHSDCNYEPALALEFLKYVEGLPETGWGIVYTHHDVLAAYNVEALTEVKGWDTLSFPYYFLDTDLASRLHKAGYILLIKELSGPINHTATSRINSDRYRQYVNALIYPVSERLYAQRHNNYVVENTSAKEYP